VIHDGTDNPLIAGEYAKQREFLNESRKEIASSRRSMIRLGYDRDA